MNKPNIFAVYSERGDGDFDLRAVFFNDDEASVVCKSKSEFTDAETAVIEERSYHDAHEFAAMLEYDQGDATRIEWGSGYSDEPHEFTSVLCECRGGPEECQA